jgi:DNA-binding NarL/FixJ family response regulator
MGYQGSAALRNGVPFAATSVQQREPAWGFYSQVSVVRPSAYGAAGSGGEVRSARPTMTVGSETSARPATRDHGLSAPETQSQEGKQGGPWSLTQRELDVLQLLAEGATNSEISERLFISPKTTKNHLAAIFQKLDVTNRTHALVRAVVMGLVTIE